MSYTEVKTSPKMSPLIKKYYDSWLVGPLLFSHPSEEEKFYKFVKACCRYGKRSDLSGKWLREHLRKDLPKVYADKKYIKQQIEKAISLFEKLKHFQQTRFPNYSLEKRNRF